MLEPAWLKQTSPVLQEESGESCLEHFSQLGHMFPEICAQYIHQRYVKAAKRSA